MSEPRAHVWSGVPVWVGLGLLLGLAGGVLAGLLRAPKSAGAAPARPDGASG